MPRTARTKRSRKNAGYSLVMLIFMVATAMIVLSAAVPSVLTEGRREREDEMIWRGEQYQRAIGLYFKKFGRYPTKIDDLTKQTNGVRFLRQAYKDPMNTEDGSWRFIYVGPSGQLIGSVHSQSLLQSVLGGGGSALGGGAGGFGTGLQPPPPAGAGGTGTGTPGSDPASQAGPQFGPQAGSQFGPQAAPQAGQQPGQQPGQQSGIGQQSTDSFGPTSLSSSSQPSQGQVIGGNIIGVGSKIKKPSIRTYLNSTSYDQWEFIYNPQTQVALPGQGAAGNLIPGQGPQQQQQTPQGPPTNVPLSTQPVI